jgi:hypothetical protein
LIKFAPAANVIVCAGLERNPSLHVVKTGPLGRGQGLHGLDVKSCASHGFSAPFSLD